LCFGREGIGEGGGEMERTSRERESWCCANWLADESWAGFVYLWHWCSRGDLEEGEGTEAEVHKDGAY